VIEPSKTRMRSSMKPVTAVKSITILLADDHTIVREGLRTLLEGEGDIKVIGEAATGREAVEMAHKLQPAVIVMDIAMPMLNGLEATRQIRKARPDAKVLILSAHSDDAYLEQVMGLGASGYLIKQSSARELCQAVRAIHLGNKSFSPKIAQRLRKNGYVPNGSPTLPRKLNQLSSRELEVLQLIAEGHPNKRVAADLDISVKTVEKHRQRVMEKLAIHDTAGLTRYAIAAGIIESSVQVTII
jgi:DNA-binding NarL/FixJ family response regulator